MPTVYSVQFTWTGALSTTWSQVCVPTVQPFQQIDVPGRVMAGKAGRVGETMLQQGPAMPSGKRHWADREAERAVAHRAKAIERNIGGLLGSWAGTIPGGQPRVRGGPETGFG